MMGPVRTIEDLNQLRRAGRSLLYPDQLKILIGEASCGIAAGAKEVEAAAREAIRDLGLDAQVTTTGCIGFCQMEPLLDLILPDGSRITYHKMTPKKTRRLLTAYAEEEDLMLKGALCRTGEDLDFFSGQQKVILRNCGTIDPKRLEEALAQEAYAGAFRALDEMDPEEVIREVTTSGLRGRGGAGFPTGRKWSTARNQSSHKKYIICNADEGDPGAFMDRSVLEGDPHAVLEGMLIGAFAVGADEGIVYVRSEYPLAVKTVQHAVKEAEDLGFLGEDIFGSGFSFRVRVRRGAGAFVCGEETALIASIEGRSGEPKPRPPFPAVEGLWGKPTVINNVKTWASIGPILSRGAEWYQGLGRSNNRGTTVFSLVGAIRNTGLVEVPLGITLKEMLYTLGGGPRKKRTLKAVQTGGPSGGCIPARLFDLTVDYEKLAEAGSMMGSGGMIALDERTCMVDLSRFFLAFTAEESCGKCAPCREGTRHMLRILTRICDGEGSEEDLSLLERLARTVKDGSLCGLGGTAPNPVLSALHYFREEFEAHLVEKRCPAGVCPNLITLRIDEETCTGCGNCKAACPVEAIKGETKSAHLIDPETCTRCGACRNVCPVEAVIHE